MIRTIPTTAILLAFCFLVQLHSQTEDFKIFGYLPHYRFDEIDRVDLDKLTHLCIGFAHPDRMGILNFGEEDIFPVMVEAKSKGLKTLMTLAGGAMTPEQAANWDYWLKPWNRDKLIEEIVHLVEKYEFDGVDIDLEWDHVDRHYNGFVTSLKPWLAERGKILTAALPGRKRYKVLTDEAIQSFDYIQMMAYDLTGRFAPERPGPHSPLYFAEQSIDFWRKQGVSPEKLILGIPLYGWEFVNNTDVYSVSYGFMVSRDTAFAYDDEVGDIYYNGIPTVKAKTELALEKAGGIMFWELGQDAFNDYSLLSAAHAMTLPRPDLEIQQIEKPEAVQVSNNDPAPSLNRYAPEDIKLFLSSTQKRLFLIKKNRQKKDILLKIPDYPSGLYLLTNLVGTDLFSHFFKTQP